MFRLLTHHLPFELIPQWPWLTSQRPWSQYNILASTVDRNTSFMDDDGSPWSRNTRNLKLGTRDYVADTTHSATLGSNRPSGGFRPNRGNITPMWLFWLYCFLSRSLAQVEPSHRFLRWMAQMTFFRPRKCPLGVRTMVDVITGSAVALHCVKAHRQSQWRSPNFNPL